MKTRFLINSVISNNCDDFIKGTYLETYLKFYEDNFKKDGFLFDESTEDFYIMFEEEFRLEKDEQISISDNDYSVDWKITDITRKIITYSLNMV